MSDQSTTQGFEVPEELRADWMSVAEACQALLKTRWTISKYCSDGILERHENTYGRNVLISRASVKKFLDRFKVQAKPQKKAPKSVTKKAKTR